MLKIKTNIIFILLFIFIGCGSTNFTIIDDTISNSNKYKNAETYSGILNEYGFNEYKRIARSSIVEDEKLTEKQKNQMLESLDSFQYKNNQYLYFSLVTNAPLMNKELDLKFKIINSNNEDIAYGSTMASTMIKQYNVIVSCNYTYVVLSKTPIDIEKKKGPLKFIVTLSDNSSRTHQL